MISKGGGGGINHEQELARIRALPADKVWAVVTVEIVDDERAAKILEAEGGHFVGFNAQTTPEFVRTHVSQKIAEIRGNPEKIEPISGMVIARMP